MATREYPKELYIVCDGDIDFGFDYALIDRIEKLYKEDKTLLDIAMEVNRKPIEVFLLLWDLIEKDMLEPRGTVVF
ncbi:MAG: hypothetical protein N4A63_13455 [Vallitalea sp.]|jgi:hypothetical protein|nr:hypothetical protein [Vallitalea sp.]